MHSGKVSGSTHGLIMIPPGHVTLLANIGPASASGAVHHHVVKIEQVKNDLAIWRERDDLSAIDRKRLDAILDSWGAYASIRACQRIPKGLGDSLIRMQKVDDDAAADDDGDHANGTTRPGGRG